jgi:hypothetical protein
MWQMLFLPRPKVNFITLGISMRLQLRRPGRIAVHPHVIHGQARELLDAGLEPRGQSGAFGDSAIRQRLELGHAPAVRSGGGELSQTLLGRTERRLLQRALLRAGLGGTSIGSLRLFPICVHGYLSILAIRTFVSSNHVLPIKHRNEI